MLHGRVIRPPAVGATLVSVDDSSVRDVPGLVKVVVKNHFAGVVAEKEWHAIQAANRLKITWTPGTGLPSHRDFYAYLRSQQSTRDTLVTPLGDSTTAATPRLPTLQAASAAGAEGPGPFEASASYHTAFDRSSGQDPCDLPHGSRTPSPTSVSWTRSRRGSRRIRCERSSLERRREGSGDCGALGHPSVP